jgi:predicted small integral membrane protein
MIATVASRYRRATDLDAAGLTAGAAAWGLLAARHARLRTVFDLHVMAMATAFLVAMPGAALVYRALEASGAWTHAACRRLHLRTMAASVLVALAGGGAMVATHHPHHARSVHAVLGLGTLLLCTAQAGVALVGGVPTWHRAAGRALLHLGHAALLTGLALHAGRDGDALLVTAAALAALQGGAAAATAA